MRAACVVEVEVEVEVVAAAVAEVGEVEVAAVEAEAVEAVGGLIAAAAALHIVEVQRVALPLAVRLPAQLCNRDHKLQDHKPQDKHRLPVRAEGRAFNNHRDRLIRRPETNCAQDSPARQPGDLASNQAERLKAGLLLERDQIRALQEIEDKPVFDRVRAV